MSFKESCAMSVELQNSWVWQGLPKSKFHHHRRVSKGRFSNAVFNWVLTISNYPQCLCAIHSSEQQLRTSFHYTRPEFPSFQPTSFAFCPIAVHLWEASLFSPNLQPGSCRWQSLSSLFWRVSKPSSPMPCPPAAKPQAALLWIYSSTCV